MGGLDSAGQPAEQRTGVLVVPGLIDQNEWQELADKYKSMQPRFEEAKDADR